MSTSANAEQPGLAPESIPGANTDGDLAFQIGTFIDYKRVVLSLAGDLKQLGEFARQLELHQTAKLVAEVLERVEGDSFTVAVVGEFKRGKSTFINALLGVSVLPTDVLPCSATLNRVSYGLTPRAVLRFKDDREEDVPFNQLQDYVTKLTDQSTEIAKTIREATVYYPSLYCQNNVDVIDTPGLNDEMAMTDVTLSILPHIDAAIMVILAQAPFSEYERDFLENRLLAADLGRVIFVVNGIDNFHRPEDADRVVQAVERRIQQQVIERARRQYGETSPEYEIYVKKIGKPRVFGLSAHQAVDAKQRNDSDLLERSRFPVFERELQRLVTERRGAIKLQVPVNRIIAACRDMLDAVSLRRNALTLKQDEFDSAYKKSLADIEGLKQRKTAELSRIKQAGEATLAALTPMAEALPDRLLSAADQALDAAEIVLAELDQSERLKQRLGKLVDNAVRRESETQSAVMQARVNDALAAEVERLAEFAASSGSLLDRIKVNFGGVKAEEYFRGPGETWAAAIAVFTGCGGVWSGYRQAGAKGAAVGAVASVGTAFAAGLLLVAISAPISLPVLIGIGVLSILPGSLAAKWAFPKDRVEHFRRNYKEAVRRELDQALRRSELLHQVCDQVRSAFATLQDRVHQEVDASLADGEKTLSELRSRYERESVLSETEGQELTEIDYACRSMGEAASRLSRQLAQIMEI